MKSSYFNDTAKPPLQIAEWELVLNNKYRNVNAYSTENARALGIPCNTRQATFHRITIKLESVARITTNNKKTYVRVHVRKPDLGMV